MTKEEVIRTLQDTAWLGPSETRCKTIEAVSTAIAAISMADMLEDYLVAYRKGILKLDAADGPYFQGVVTALGDVIDHIRFVQERLYDK